MELRFPFQKNHWFLIIIFVLFSIASGTAGYFFHENQKRVIKEEKRGQLGAIADFKIKQMSHWREDRMADASVIIECSLFAHLVAQYFRSPMATKVKQEILNWMEFRQKHYQYQSLHLTDSKGSVRLSVPKGKEVPGPDAKTLCAEAIEKKGVIFSDLYRSKISNAVRLTLVVPILVPEGPDVIGVLLLRMDPHQFLYPLVQSVPTYSHSSETLLLRREGEYVVLLNELRHQRNTALTVHIPVSDEQLPISKAAFGEEGIFEWVDYRGVPVIGAMRRVPNTAWFLVAKVDREEIYAPIRRWAWFTGIVVSVLIVGAGVSGGFFWRHQRAQFYRRQYEAELERQALARHFEYLTKYANDVILLVDQDMRIVDANDRAVESYGYSSDELFHLGLRELQSFETRSQLLVPMKQVGEDGGIIFETEHQRKDGTRFPVEISSRVIEVEGKRFYQNIIRDITERKRAEEVVRKSEHYFRSLLFNIHEDILVIDRDYRVTDVNNTLLLTVGLERDEVIGRHCYEILHNYSQSCSRYGEQCLLQDTFESGEPRNCRHIHTRMDTQSNRSKVWVDILLSPLKDEHGKVTHVIEAMRDITDLVMTGEALQESEERYRTAIEHSGDGVAIVRGDYPIFVNQKFVNIFGYDRPEEVIGKPLSMIVHADDIKRMKEISDVEQKDGPVILGGESRGIRKDGNRISIEISATQTIYRGEVVYLVYLRDITEQKKKEQEMGSLQEQLRQSQKMEAIGRLAGGIAHDLGNLLAVVQGYSELSLLRLPKEEPLRENIEEIRTAGGRAVDLTRRLLAFSRRQVMEMEIIDLNTIVRNLEKVLRRVIGEDIQLVILLADDLGKIKADPGQIEQVILNLAVNARDAMPSRGKLAIGTDNVELDETYTRNYVAVKPGPYVMLSVSDTGVGMAPEVRERVFEPFFTTKEKGRGTGLGLSTVYGIVKQSGGNIWVYSELGYGTTFKIYLPRVEKPLKRVEEKKILEESPRGNETILVVEDEEKVLKLVAEILTEQGYRVLGTPRGGDALLICGQHKGPIHLMVTDVVMPEMNGHELAGRLAPLHPEMKVIYMSGYPDDAIIHYGVLEEGINFIQKPFTFAELARKVRKVLDKDSNPVV